MPASRKKRHQTTSACARCYRLKQKCDRGTPKCFRCVRAGTDCVAINRQTSTEIPRSPLQYLEQRLAELQCKSGPKQADSHVEKARASPSSPAHSHAPYYRRLMKMASCFVGDHLTAELLVSHPAIHYQSKLFYPSERPPLKVPVHGRYSTGRTARLQASYFRQLNPQKMPLEVARRLFHNYKDHILPRYPFFKVNDLERHFERAFRTGLADEHDTAEARSSNFIVSMVLAISCLTSTRNDFHTVAALSERLHQNAMQNMHSMQNTTFLREASVRSLQCLLLLIQMALLLPETINLWYTSGEAMRMAISLGLHRQSVLDLSDDPPSDEFRRNLFWVTYVLERTVAIAAGCPLALADEHISTELPELPFFSQEFQTRVPGVTAKKKHFLNHVQACQLQSHIHAVQLFNQPLPENSPDYNSWVEATKESIETLISQIAEDGVAPSWLVMATRQCQVLLYRPCSRNIAPTTRSLVAAAQASIDFIKSSLDVVTAGGFILAFELSNCCFHAGMVLLYILNNHGREDELINIIEGCQEALDILVQVFDILSKRWPAISDASHYIRGLRETSQRNSVGNGGACQEDVDILAEIDGLVTQRRVHGIYYRPTPSSTDTRKDAQHTSPTNSDLPSLGDDEIWWQEFINADFASPNNDPLPVPSPTPQGQVVQAPAQRPLPRIKRLTSPKSSVSVDDVLLALPACSYCRDRRMKCHRQVPSCLECSRTSRECLYFDPVLLENVPLKRISVLLEQITHLEAQISLARSPSRALTPHQSGNTPHQSYPDSILVPLNRTLSSTDDHYCLFGQWSSFGLLLTYPREELHQSSELDLFLSMNQNSRRFSGLTTTTTTTTGNGDLPPIAVATRLFDIFARSVNVFFPVVENSSLETILHIVYNSDDVVVKGCHDQNRQLFFTILAIASLVAKRSDPNLPFLGNQYFNQATRHFDDESCDHASKASQIFIFQRTLLISLYLLLSPSAGDIWRNLGFAIRLFFDLSHRSFVEGDEELHLFHMLTRTLYCLESLVSTAFGRPTLLVIGDQLRAELLEEIEGTPEERLSIMSYQISFLTMQFHSILLKHSFGGPTPPTTTTTTLTNSGDQTGGRTDTNNTDAQQHHRALDDWLVCWKKYVETLMIPSEKETMHPHLLLAVGEFRYYHALYILSQACPTLGISVLGVCDKMARCCTSIARWQQAAASTTTTRSDNDGQRSSSFIYPVSWTMSHAVFQAALCMISSMQEGGASAYQDGGEIALAMRRCLTCLSLLESDPDNLSTGLAATLEALCG